MSQWMSINPLQVSEFINFKAANSEWCYQEDKESMFAKQAEGTAMLYNYLAEHNIALLADEVGMGKTYQALGLAALLWKQKPDAKILIIAPNNSIANNWCEEYGSFIKKNYRSSDNIVRTTIGNEPVYKPYFCSSLQEIADVAKEGWCHLFVAKTSSFSYVLNQLEEDGRNRLDAARENAKNIRQQIPFAFDLLIVDEAHYFRNVNGGSLRVHSAQGFFDGDNNPLAEKVVLLTATPNHSGAHDVKNIVSYFDQSLARKKGEEVLECIGVRRLRRLAGKNKYEYRKEISDKADFGGDSEAELFFAMYQKKLAEIPQGSSGRRFMYGYLEGFESITPNDPLETDDTVAEGAEREQQKTDYKSSVDTEILKELAHQFKRVCGRPPAHPKYDLFSGNLTGCVVGGDLWQSTHDISENKHLVFTRRIPSVTEITGRINLVYDEEYLKKIGTACGFADNRLVDLLRLENPDDFRRKFSEQLSITLSEPDDADTVREPTEDTESEGGQERLFEASRVLDLFTVKKKGKEGSNEVMERTHASNFRTRFNAKNTRYSLFFEPASDYKTAGYPKWKSEENQIKVDYRDKASKYRSRKEIISAAPAEPDTLWALFYQALQGSGVEAHIKIRKTLDGFTPEWKEAFAKFLYKGVLFASSALIELYCSFIAVQKSGDGKYESFFRQVKQDFANSHLFALLIEVTGNFREYTEKVCAATSIEKVKEQKWLFFNNQNPAASVTGSTASSSRESLIRSFNSPFFPNVLISTSVLQEGVNLQYFCRNVHHYGIAWTPGDNEQRVGRIDRLFSLTERKLGQDSSSEASFLQSRYPFLQGTLDETQLVSFLKNKFEVENITDRCGSIASEKEIDTNITVKNWKNFLRTPVALSDRQDPYTTLEFPESSYVAQLDPFPDFQTNTMLKLVHQVLEKLQNNRVIGEYTFYTPVQVDGCDDLHQRRTIGMVDVKLNEAMADGEPRHQPFYVELFFSSEFSGVVEGLVYCLRFVTPFDKGNNNFKKDTNRLFDCWVQPAFQAKFPLTKLALRQSGGFHNCMVVDLPFFFDETDVHHLDESELCIGLQQLLLGADLLEQQALGRENDLRLETHGFAESFINYSPFSDNPERDRRKITVVNSPWYQSQDCIVKKHTINGKWKQSFHREMMLLENYEFPCVSYYQDSTDSYCKIAMPFVDLQERELKLIENCFQMQVARFSQE